MIKLYSTSPNPRVRISPGQKVARKYRRNYLRKVRQREYHRLRKIVPTIADKKVDKVTVVEEAIRYIDHLHEALAQRLVNMGMPVESVTQETMLTVIRHLAPPSLTQPFNLCEPRKPLQSDTPLQHLHTVPPPHLHNAPQHLHNAPPHLHNTPPHLHNTPPHLHNAPPHLHKAPTPHLHKAPTPHLHKAW